MLHIEDESQIDDVTKKALLQLFQQRVLVASKTVQEYYDVEKLNIRELLEKQASGQIVIMGNGGPESQFPLTNSDELEEILQEFSKRYQNVIEVYLERKGTYDVEYRVVHSD